jgi:hypothetical protein
MGEACCVASRQVSTRRNDWAQSEPFRQDRAPAGQARRQTAGGMTCRARALLHWVAAVSLQARSGLETRELAVLLVGIDWAKRHHDVCVMAADGTVLARERIADGWPGWPGCTSSSPAMPATRPRW